MQPIPADAIDPRNPLMTLKRNDLVRIVQHFKLPADVDSPAEILRTIIRDAQENKKIKFKIMPPKNRMADIRGRLVLPEVQNKENVDYSGLKRFELMRLCKERGIHASNKDSNETLKMKLNG